MTADHARHDLDAFDLAAVAPFDLVLTVSALRRRPANLVERMTDGEYQRTLDLSRGSRLVAVRQIAGDRISVRALDGPLSAGEREEVARLLIRILGLDVDLAAAWQHIAADPRLARLGEGLAGLKPPCFPDLWTTLLNIVPYQQVSLDAGMSVANRLTRQLGTAREVGGECAYGYATPERMLRASVEELRACGLSAAKARTLQGIAEAVLAGRLADDEFARLDDEEALARLVSLPGIGPWSAKLTLLRGMRRLAFFPPGDSGAARNVRLFLGVEDTKQAYMVLDELSEELGPYRGLLYFLLLGQRLRSRGELPGA